MSLRINTNMASITAQRAMAQTQRKLGTAMEQLSTGNRVGEPSTGAADFAISEHLRGQIRGQKAARTNAENATSFMQVAEGGLSEQTNILIRMRELAVQSASDTFSDTERGMLDLEFQQLSQEFDRVARTTKFGSTELLSGSSNDFEFQIGTGSSSADIVKFSSDANTTAGNLDVDGQSVADKSDARDSISVLDEALTTVAATRANFGAVMSRLDHVTNNSDIMTENLEAARSRIADTDIAEASSEMFKQQALTQYQLAVMSQANQFPASVLRLIA